MTHINAILLDAARQVIEPHVAGSQYRYTYEEVTLIPDISMPVRCGVEDTGERFDLASFGTVEEYLKEPAGPDHGTSSLGEVLLAALEEVMRQHGRNSPKILPEFISELSHMPFDRFLAGETEQDVTQRETRLRRRLDKLGYRLVKARTGNPFHFLYRTYTVIHRQTHEVNIDAPTNLPGLEAWTEKQIGAETFGGVG